MKKTDSTEEASGLFVKGQRERLKSRGTKMDPEASSSFLLLLQETRAHQEKLYEIQGDAEEKMRQRFRWG